jgi:hypothetical protein
MIAMMYYMAIQAARLPLSLWLLPTYVHRVENKKIKSKWRIRSLERQRGMMPDNLLKTVPASKNRHGCIAGCSGALLGGVCSAAWGVWWVLEPLREVGPEDPNADYTMGIITIPLVACLWGCLGACIGALLGLMILKITLLLKAR